MKRMDEREQMRRWVRTWVEAGPELEAIRERELREADQRAAIASLESAMNFAVRNTPHEPWSGLVEMQAWFAKLRR